MRGGTSAAPARAVPHEKRFDTFWLPPLCFSQADLINKALDLSY